MKFYKAFFYTILLLVVWSIVQLLFLLPYKYFISELEPKASYLIILKIVSAIAAYLSVFFLFDVPKHVEKTLFKFEKITIKPFTALIFITIGLYLIDRLLWDLFNGILVDAAPSKNNFKPINFLSISFALQVLSTVIISPLLEELFFRKFLFKQLLLKQNLLVSVGVSSMCFSLIHIETPHNLLPTFLAGVIYAMVYYKTNNSTYTIVLHSLFNFVIIFFGIDLALFYGSLNYNNIYYLLAIFGVALLYASLNWLFYLKK